jgi:hypothetical protein
MAAEVFRIRYPHRLILEFPVPLPSFKATDLGATPSMSEIIAKHLREAIISGQLAEGEPVRSTSARSRCAKP